MRKTVIGVMGGGESAPPRAVNAAYRLGALIAARGWVLLNGGRDAGVMAASAAGAHSQGGLVVGVLPDRDAHRAAPDVDIAIVTGMGDARNAINVLSSDVVVACAGGAGTVSEIALALKAGRTVVLLDFEVGPLFDAARDEGCLLTAATPEDAVAHVERVLAGG